MSPSPLMAPCVLFGGSFDPVHYGHLRLAIEVAELLQSEVKLLPSPAQAMKTNRASAQQRFDMLTLALDGAAGARWPRLLADDSEINRRDDQDRRPVYTIDTLDAYRQQLPTEQPLIFVMGMDAFLNIRSWHEWRRLLCHAHLLVIARPGHDDTKSSHALAQLMDDADLSAAFADSIDVLLGLPVGRIYIARLSLLDISSSQIRGLISDGRCADYLTAPAVLDYIGRAQLYKSESGHKMI